MDFNLQFFLLVVVVVVVVIPLWVVGRRRSIRHRNRLCPNMEDDRKFYNILLLFWAHSAQHPVFRIRWEWEVCSIYRNFADLKRHSHTSSKALAYRKFVIHLFFGKSEIFNLENGKRRISGTEISHTSLTEPMSRYKINQIHSSIAFLQLHGTLLV